MYLERPAVKPAGAFVNYIGSHFAQKHGAYFGDYAD